MDKLIIGITGKANSGKDTIASMINYFHICDKKDISPTFSAWERDKELYCYNEISDTPNNRIVHFADNLKQVLSIIYGIDLKYFYDRKYKDYNYYDLINHKFIDTEEYVRNTKYIVFNIEELNEDIANLDDFITVYRFKNQIPVIKLRTLLQYFGTELCRKNLGDNIWINSCLNNCLNIKKENLVIIADVRFPSEIDALLRIPYNLIIKIVRPNNEIPSVHSSENYDISTCDLLVDNNGTLLDLYTKMYELYKENIKYIIPQ